MGERNIHSMFAFRHFMRWPQRLAWYDSAATRDAPSCLRTPRRNRLFLADQRGGAPCATYGCGFAPFSCTAGLIVLLSRWPSASARKWNTFADIAQLRATKQQLEAENNSYRAATGRADSQIQSLETIINDLGARSAVDPAQLRRCRSCRPSSGRAQPVASSTSNLAMNALANAPDLRRRRIRLASSGSAQALESRPSAACAATWRNARSWQPRPLDLASPRLVD